MSFIYHVPIICNFYTVCFCPTSKQQSKFLVLILIPFLVIYCNGSQTSLHVLLVVLRVPLVLHGGLGGGLYFPEII